jgi:glycosyltransferase involved in cell wall biosynthesis
VDWIWHPDNVSLVDQMVRSPRPRLRVAYLIPHHNVTGGMKMIVAQIAGLRARGHYVLAVFRGAPGSPVMPPWAHIAADEEILLDAAESVSSILSLVDVFLVGYFTQLLEFRELTECAGPIVYWDQGHEHVFGDPSAHPEWDRVFHQVMHLPIVLLSVSDIIRDILLVHFARVAPVVPNAIDAILFRPVDAHRRQLARSNRIRGLELSADTRHVLLVGNPALPLKNHHIALQALNRVAARIPLHLTWICQVQPVISGLLFPVTFAVDPAQEELPALYAGGYDVFVFPSLYEAWGMPVLEVSPLSSLRQRRAWNSNLLCRQWPAVFQLLWRSVMAWTCSAEIAIIV